MNVLSDATALLGGTTYTYPGRIAAGYAENAEIVDCIAKHDPIGAERAAQHHVRAISAVRIAMARGYR